MEMRDLYLNSWQLLGVSERRRLLVLSALITCAGFAEMAALSSVSLMVPLLIAPASIGNYAPLQLVISCMGYSDSRAAFLLVALSSSVLIALSLLFSYATSVASLRFGNSVARRIAAENFAFCLQAPYAWHLGQSASVLAQKCFSDPEKIGKGLFPAILDQAYSFVLLFVGIAFILTVSPWQNLLALGGIGVIACFIVIHLRPQISIASDQARRKTLDISGLSVEALSAVKDIQIKHAQPLFFRQFEGLFAGLNLGLEKVAALQKASHSILTGIGQIGIVAIAVTMLLTNTAPDEIATHLALMLLLLSRILPALSRTVASLNGMSAMRPYLSGVMQLRADIRDLSNRCQSNDVGPEVPMDWRRIEFDKVSFKYVGSKNTALRGVNISLERGGCYGFVGPSGAGKTTLSDILLGLLDPTDGRFGFDGCFLNKFSRSSWVQQVGYVPQSPFVLNDTVRRNVALGVPDDGIDDDQVVAALNLAGFGEVLLSLERGLDTKLGDRGSRLSGGQRQRLAIARALYQKPKVLVLDEATSALDSINEQHLQRTIERLRGQLTILIIAHRLHVIAGCDKIFVMEDGRVVDEGDFRQLSTSSKLFSEMLSSARIVSVQ